MGKASRRQPSKPVVLQPVEQEQVPQEQVQAPAEVSTEQAPPATTETGKGGKKDRSKLYAAPALIPANGVITLLVTSNPKRAAKKSAPRFDLYRTGMTVPEHTKAYEDAGHAKSLANADRRWDVAHGFIRVDAPAPAEQPAEQAAS